MAKKPKKKEPLLPWGIKVMHYMSTDTGEYCTQGEVRFARLSETMFCDKPKASEVRDANRADCIKVVEKLRIDLVRSLEDTDRYLREVEEAELKT